MSISRRDLLKRIGSTAGAAAGAAVVAGTSRDAAAAGIHHFEGYPDRYGLLHDTTLCTGCRSCEAACAEVNDLPAPAIEPGDDAAFDVVRRTSDEALTVVNRYVEARDDQPPVFRKHQCMHCNEPCCASVCLVHAFTKTPEGPVLYDPDVCIGCRYCVMACPYYALGYEYDEPLTPRVMRCTMCYDRVVEGLNPGCADACPTGAITFGKRDELLTLARERFRKHPGRYVHHIFGEHEFGGTSWLTLAARPFGELGLPEHVTHASLPDIGTRFLSVVPMVVTIYPGLLAGFYAFTRRKDRIHEDEARARVVEALTRADEQTRAQLAAAATRAGEDKERAIAMAVKRALAEDARRREEEAQGAADAPDGGGAER